jgi:hypothetical protein
MEKPVRLQDKVRNPPLRFFPPQRAKLFVAKKAAAEKILLLRDQRKFLNHFPELVPGIIGLNNDHFQAFRLFPDLPAPGQKHPPFGSGRLHGPAEVRSATIKGVEPENSQLPDQFPQRPIDKELHFKILSPRRLEVKSDGFATKAKFATGLTESAGLESPNQIHRPPTSLRCPGERAG